MYSIELNGQRLNKNVKLKILSVLFCQWQGKTWLISSGYHSDHDSPVDSCGSLPLWSDSSQSDLVYTLHISTEVNPQHSLKSMHVLCSNPFSKPESQEFGSKKEAMHTNQQQRAPHPFQEELMFVVTATLDSVLLTYFVDGVWCSAGEYGAGYHPIGTSASSLWSWSSLFSS